MVPWVQVVGIFVTIILFLVGQSIAFFKWIKSNSVWMATMEERTNIMVGDLRKVNKSLEMLATADLRMSRLEASNQDHEQRIRALEKGDD